MLYFVVYHGASRLHFTICYLTWDNIREAFSLGCFLHDVKSQFYFEENK